MRVRPFDNSVVHRLAYLARLLALPLLCFAVAFFALNRADAANQQIAERPRVDQPAPVTPVLSARRVAAALAFPGRAAQLAAVLDPLVGSAAQDASCAMVTNRAGAPIYARNPSLPMIPASNQKLLTAYTALAVLGPDHRFRTTLATDAQVVNGVVQGDVWLIGGGDPVLATSDYAASFAHQPQLFTDLTGLLGPLKAAGITRIQGALIADASRYDDQRYVQGWPSRFASGVGENPSGPLSALDLNDGFTSFPPAGQQYGGSGTRTAASNPPLATGQAVGDMLRGNGISIVGGVKVGKAVPVTNPLSFVDSPPLGEIVGAMLRESDNTAAELLLKEIGVAKSAQGTTAAGAAAMALLLTERGIAGPELVVVDGSGLAAGDRVTCNFLIRVLAVSGPDGPLAAGLPVAGQSGTLADRFAGTPGVGRVRAKTGTLSEVSALSGWATTQPGELVIFAMVTNSGDEEAAAALEDQIANALLAYPQGATLAQLGPKPVG
jgi:D-alanyl-D-alanine carboxypeptidase/D-alanyl-D-alanine-endopeptidase (penicillin-binding protein 4)